MLSGAGLRDDALLAHPLRQQALAQGVVDLVRSGVGQVLALQVDARAAAMPGQVLGVVQRGGPAGVVSHQVVKLLREPGVVLGGAVGRFQLGEGGHHRFGNEFAAEITEAAPFVR